MLEKAVAADPRFPLGHSALSEAWWHLGYNNNARAEAQRARELSNDLGQEDRWLIEGQYWRSMNNWTRAVQAYQDLFHRFPDSLDYGLLLATAQLDAVDSQPSAALQTLAALRRLPPPAGPAPNRRHRLRKGRSVTPAIGASARPGAMCHEPIRTVGSNGFIEIRLCMPCSRPFVHLRKA